MTCPKCANRSVSRKSRSCPHCGPLPMKLDIFPTINELYEELLASGVPAIRAYEVAFAQAVDQINREYDRAATNQQESAA